MVEFATGAIIGAVTMMLVLGAFAGSHIGGRYQSDAIKRGYALYCPTTGEWAWKGECDQ